MKDLIDLATVPSAVRDRVQTFRDTAADRNAALRRIGEEVRGLSDQMMVARSRLEKNRRDFEQSGDRAALEAAESEIERLDGRIKRLNARAAEVRPAWESAQRLVSNLESFVREHAGSIVLYDGDVPQLQNGETALAGLERAARRTRTLRADRQEVLAAPFPSTLAKRLAWEQMTARIEAAKPDATSLIDRLEPMVFPLVRLAVRQHGGSPVDVEGGDALAQIGWLFPNELRAAIDAEIDAAADDAAALSPQQRAAKLAEIDADVLASEREEAAFAELAGLLPSPDLNPLAILGLAGPDHMRSAA